jgi:hypothetical protein
MKAKRFANGNCDECSLQNLCPAPIINKCPEIHVIKESQWEMGLNDCDYNVMKG